jgi:hypothetical protein
MRRIHIIGEDSMAMSDIYFYSLPISVAQLELLLKLIEAEEFDPKTVENADQARRVLKLKGEVGRLLALHRTLYGEEL